MSLDLGSGGHALSQGGPRVGDLHAILSLLFTGDDRAVLALSSLCAQWIAAALVCPPTLPLALLRPMARQSHVLTLRADVPLGRVMPVVSSPACRDFGWWSWVPMPAARVCVAVPSRVCALSGQTI